MKVFIITEGGKNIGLGHIARCSSLYHYFEEKGIVPEFIVNGDETVQDLLMGKSHKVFNWLEQKQTLFNAIEDADIVIIDSYLADFDCYKKISEIVRIPVYMDDCKRIDYPRGIVVNGCIYAEELNYPQKEDVIYLLGSQYISIRKEFWVVPDKEIKENIESIMITFGGDDAKDLTPKILKFLKEEYAEVTKNVVIGTGFKNIKEIENLKDKKINLIYYPDAEGMKELMLKSDIAISANGQTLCELARVGVPTIGICVTSNQLGNSEGWKKAGFLEYIGWYNDKNLIEELKNSMKYLKQIRVREKKYQIGRKFVDGKGSLRVVKDLLFNLFINNLSLRSADFKDALDVFNLANDEIVRSYFLNSEKIEWEHHLRWFKEKLENEDCVYFVINNFGKFYGQVRFDINPKEKDAIINISLQRNLRGLGLSSSVIEKSIDKLLKIRKDVKLIKAYIKEKNIPSIKSFERANFKFLENVTIKKNRTRLYIKEVDNVKV